MGERIKKLKKIRIHREGTHELTWSALAIVGIAYLLWYSFSTTIPFWIFIIVFGAAWLMALNFYRCPIRYYNGDTDKLVVAPADGKIVVVEEAEEKTKSGIILSSGSQEKPQMYEVIEVGPGGIVDGKEVVMTVKPGDMVITGKYSGTEVKIEGETYMIVSQNDILAVVEE